MTVETHGMQFVVDASGVAKGFRDYEAAVDGIFKSLTTFEKKVASTMSAIERAASNRAALAGFKKSLDQFSNIRIDTAAASKLGALSAAMAGFRAPSEAQSVNTRKFFSSLSNLPDLSKAYASIKNLDQLKAAMASFKAPPLSQANNLVKFAQSIEKAAPAFRSLGRIAGVSGVANELASISIAMRGMKVPSASEITRIGNLALALQHLSRVSTGETGQMIHALAGIGSFKAPSAANIKNLSAFAEALHQIKPIPNAPLIATQMNMIASAASRASVTLGGFRGNLGGFNPAYGRFNEGTRSAKVEMMGLQNAFSGTFQVGSVLRSLLGSLTVAELGRAFFQATQDANQFRAAMEVLGTTPAMTDQSWERVRADANHFGADLHTMSEQFSKFSLAAHENGVSLQESFKIFEGFQTVETATHMGTEQQQSVGLAIREMMDQGYVSTARLTRQLGLVLPGATATLMKAWKEAGNKMSLWDALKKKMVDSTWALDVLSNHYKDKFGPAVKQALESPIQQFNILKNNIMQMMVEIGDAGAKKAFSDLIAQLSGYMDPTKAHTFAQAIGVGVTKAVRALSDAIGYLHDHWATIGPIIGTTIKYMAEWEMLMAGMKIGSWIVSPLLGLGRAVGVIKNVTTALSIMGAATLPMAAAGAAKLEGRTASVVTSFLEMRKAATIATAAMSLEMLAADGLAASLMVLGRAAATGVVAGLRGIISLLGGPWLLTFAAASYAAYKLYETYGEASEKIADSNKFIQDSNKVISEATSKIYLHTDAVKASTKAGIDFNDCTLASSQAGGFLDQYAAKMDKVTGGLYSQAAAARQTTIDTLRLQQVQTQGKIADLSVDSNQALGGKVKELWGQGRYALAAGGVLKMGTNAISSGTGWDASQKDINGELAKLQAHQNQISGNIAAVQAETPMDIVKKWQAHGNTGAPDATNSHYQGTEAGDHKKKGKKGPDPYSQMKQAENAVDTLMSELESKDPIGKLYSDFVKNIDKEAQTLLNFGGFKQFVAGVKASSGSAAAETQALIRVLEEPKNVNAKTMKALEDRYHTDIPGIIELLKAQLDDLSTASVEAAAKTIDATYRGVIKARHTLDEYNPVGKADDASQKKQDTIAQSLFKTADPNLLKVYQSFKTGIDDGTSDAADSLGKLKIAVEAARDPTNAFHDNLVALEVTGVNVSDVLKGMTQQLALERAEAERAGTFGGTLLAQKTDELKLMGLTNDQADIMKTLQQEVQNTIKAGFPVDEQKIQNLKQQLELDQALGQQMERNKQFFDDNGVRSYLNGIQDVGAAVNELDKNTLQGLEDQLVSLGETGKFSFNKIFDTIRNGMIHMAAQGLMKSFTTAIFGKDAVDGGTPSIFGGTVGKAMGGYKPSQMEKLGTKMNPMYVSWAGDFNAMTVSTKNDSIMSKFQKPGAVMVDGIPQNGDQTWMQKAIGAGGYKSPADLLQAKTVLGTSAMTPMWVRDASNPMGGGLGLGGSAAGGTGGNGITFPNGHSYSYDKDGYLTPTGAGTPLNGATTTLGGTGAGGAGAGGVGQGSPAATAGAAVATSFKTNMAQMMPMIGMMFASQFKSPIAQIGAMFLSMMLEKMLMSNAAGGAGGGGGKGGGILGSIMGMLAQSGGGAAPVPGALEGGVVGQFVNSYRASPAAFVNAPHYSEGTPNTSGGMPAILHDNEAVIPLSRGRKVPVELTREQSSANGKPIQINFNVTSPDADSFQNSKQQIMTNLHVAATRAYARNNG